LRGRYWVQYDRDQHSAAANEEADVSRASDLPIHSAPHPAGKRRTTHDEIGLARIRRVVDDFYDRIQRHPKLAVPFGIVEDWPSHKARLTHFWWLSLGGEAYAPYAYRVGAKHATVGISNELIDEWLTLFRVTLDEHLPKALADAWFQRASRMGDSLRMLSTFYAQRAAAQQPSTRDGLR